MCGIVGYFGKNQATPILMDGLSKLEYRGYDSAGVAILTEDSLSVRKMKGRLSNLSNSLNDDTIKGCIGIGHTRWATHGEPSDLNSHPHVNAEGSIAVVHNGIIENYIQLKKWLIEKGYSFYSETDTEVIPKLIDYFYKGDLLKAVEKTTKLLQGSYALGAICKSEPDKIVAVRKDSPLIVGLGKNEWFIASDIPAILSYTREIYLLEDNEFVTINKNGVKISDENGQVIYKAIYEVNWNISEAEKNGFSDFMLKEINDQPKAIKDTIAGRCIKNKRVNLDNITITRNDLKNFDRIFIVACGTAYHAGLIGKTIIENLAKIPVEVDIASEFRYRDPLITEKSLMIVISQSGETADTLAVLRKAKNIGSRVIAITNVVGSSVSREADEVIYTWAGPEISVASTKAYETQLVALYMIGLLFGELRERVSQNLLVSLKEELIEINEKVETLLSKDEVIKAYVAKNIEAKDIFFLGRGLDYSVALEGSLKLKEISYIHSEAYAGGELKHGPIALIEEGIPVIALITQKELKDKMISNIREVKARGAKILAIAIEGDEDVKDIADDVIYIPETLSLLTPLLSVVPLQLLAYNFTIQKGLDVDKPRNLAKSVTVE